MSLSVSVIKQRVRGLVWTGSLAYRKMSLTYEKRVLLCPLCQHELEPVRYFGSKVFQKNTSKPDYVSNFWSPLYENGELVWYSAPDLQKFNCDW
jgi:hypothetical protein